MDALKDWMARASTLEKHEMARLAQTSVAYLHQIATGHRKASAELAGRLEIASGILADKTANVLPRLRRLDLCAACAVCPYARGCDERKD